ncbi:MAG: hypothetical protein K6U80_16465 [Firmicutes bacterium]|nr:hypothetical protein [Bacillota bacterium]
MIIIRAVCNILHKISRFYLDWRVIWKLAGGFGLILIILLLIVEISQMSLQLFNRKLITVIDEELEPMVYLNDIRSCYYGIGDWENNSKLLCGH